MAISHEREDSREGLRGGAASVFVTRRVLAWVGAGATVMAPLGVAGSPVHANVVQAAIALAICIAAVAVQARAGSGRLTLLVGVALCALAAWLLAQASYPTAAWVVAPVLGVGIGMTVPAGAGLPRAAEVASAAVVAAALCLLRALAGREVAMASGAAAVAIAAAAALPLMPAPSTVRHASVAGIAALIAGAVTAYIGATTPRATWFGKLDYRGPRGSGEVAVTFDDGPNPPYTLQIRDILKQRGVKATFFTVGKALDKRPDVSRSLMAEGMLVASHSYHHDAVSWLDPRYEELRDADDAFLRNLGVRPRFYRPPHGTHTPFMAHQLSNKGMRMVTWDVSARDWETDDAELVARRVLERVKPGSIILLHDGIDGNIGADRTVVVKALPLILDGLASRGLSPVTLDKLFGVSGYVVADAS